MKNADWKKIIQRPLTSEEKKNTEMKLNLCGTGRSLN